MKEDLLCRWFGDPESEVFSEETGGEIILKKNNEGHVIGFEKLNFLAPAELKRHPVRMPVEVIVE